MKKFKNHQRPRRNYRFNIVGHKKALQIWWDSPFKLLVQQMCELLSPFFKHQNLAAALADHNCYKQIPDYILCQQLLVEDNCAPLSNLFFSNFFLNGLVGLCVVHFYPCEWGPIFFTICSWLILLVLHSSVNSGCIRISVFTLGRQDSSHLSIARLHAPCSTLTRVSAKFHQLSTTIFHDGFWLIYNRPSLRPQFATCVPNSEALKIRPRDMCVIVADTQPLQQQSFPTRLVYISYVVNN
jgi:hypothetical protein